LTKSSFYAKLDFGQFINLQPPLDSTSSAMESALSPNTAAFLDYLSTQLQSNEQDNIDPKLAGVGNNATSLPPSAFFQLPDTKPDISSYSASTSISPVETKQQSGHAHRSVSLSGSEGDGTAVGALGADGLHKRKAGLSHTVEEDEGEDDGRSMREMEMNQRLTCRN
jgi:hypothetical protein